MYGIESSTFGTLIPFLSEIGPPFRTVQIMSLPSITLTRISINPSSMSILVPTETSAGRFL